MLKASITKKRKKICFRNTDHEPPRLTCIMNIDASWPGLLGALSGVLGLCSHTVQLWFTKIGWHTGSDIIQALMFHLVPV